MRRAPKQQRDKSHSFLGVNFAEGRASAKVITWEGHGPFKGAGSAGVRMSAESGGRTCSQGGDLLCVFSGWDGRGSLEGSEPKSKDLTLPLSRPLWLLR